MNGSGHKHLVLSILPLDLKNSYPYHMKNTYIHPNGLQSLNLFQDQLYLHNKLLQIYRLNITYFLAYCFCRAGVQAQLHYFPCSGHHTAATKMSSELHSILELRITFQALMLVGWIQFLEVIGLRSLFSCWLLAMACSQLHKATQCSLPPDPFTSFSRKISLYDFHLINSGPSKIISLLFTLNSTDLGP